MEDHRAHERIDGLEKRMATFEVGLAENTNVTKRVETNTSELVTLIKGAKGFRAFVLWVTPVAATVGVLYTYVKDHWK